MKVLETERIILHHTELSDAPFLFELYNTPKWIKFIGDRNIRSVYDAKQYIVDHLRPQIEESGYGNYIIRYQDKPIGVCGLYNRKGLEGVDLGFALHPSYEGRGFATESSKALMAVAWDDLSLESISAITLEVNVSSRKVLQKLGFTYIKKISCEEDSEELLLYRAWAKKNYYIFH